MNQAGLTSRLTGRPISRRALLQGTAGAAAGSAVLLSGACGGSDGGPSVKRGPVEQQKQLRMGTGVTAWDDTKTFDGYTVFAPNRGRTAYAIDMDGEVVNEWELVKEGEEGSVWVAELLPNGNLFALLHRASGEAPPFVFKGGVAMEVDWTGNVIWRFDDPDQHHDGRLLSNGNLLMLRTEPIPVDVAQRVPGGLATQEETMWADWVAEVTLEGMVVWEWHAWEHLDPEAVPLNAQDQRNEWTHGNSIAPTADGNVLISFRNINTVAIIDRTTGDIDWSVGAPLIAQQHDAIELEDGNILVFDNGAHRLDGSIPYSRVLEIDRGTKEIAWQYQDAFLMNFFSPFISGARRLPNGNTLITEGMFGRMFEVTAEQEVVWEYVSPFVTVDQVLGTNNAIFRASRYPREAANRA